MRDFRQRTRFLLGEAARSAQSVAEQLGDDVARLADALVTALENGGKVLVCGNGGSAADAQHFAAELVNRYRIDRPPLAGLALTTDSSILTSVGNDFHFDEVFAKQVRALGRQGDLLLAITTSGNSPNILRAMEAARDMGLTVGALLGRDGGQAAARADVAVVAPLQDTARIQEVHLMIEHTLCELIDEALFAVETS